MALFVSVELADATVEQSGNSAMTTRTETRPGSQRLTAALRLVLRRYGAQLRRRPAMAAGALLLPAVGDVLTLYAPPLVVARLLGRFARDEQLHRRRPDAVRAGVRGAVAGRAGRAGASPSR